MEDKKKYQQVDLKEAMIDVINNPDNNSIYHVWNVEYDEMLSISELNIGDCDLEEYVVFKSIKEQKKR